MKYQNPRLAIILELLVDEFEMEENRFREQVEFDNLGQVVSCRVNEMGDLQLGDDTVIDEEGLSLPPETRRAIAHLVFAFRGSSVHYDWIRNYNVLVRIDNPKSHLLKSGLEMLGALVIDPKLERLEH